MKKSKYTFKTEPWSHQLLALDYLYQRDTAALYTDMGTGKTKVIIDLVYNRGFKRVLVVAPNRACDVWEEQIHVHGFDSVFCPICLNGLSTEKVINQLSKIPKIGKSGSQKEILILIINYEKVWREGVDKIFLRKTFGIDCVICDESHRIKTPTSKCSRYLARLGKIVPHRYLVTGTPLAENPIDVYAQYKFLDPSIFGTNFGKFRDEYEVIDPVLTARIGHRILNKNHPYKNLDQLRKKMFSCAFYIESSVKLPEQTDIVCKFKMPKRTEVLYKQFLQEKVSELNGMWLESTNALTTILRLQQMTSGYAKVEDIDTKETKIINVDDARRRELANLLDQFPPEEPLVIFAHYRKDIKNIRQVCRNFGEEVSEVSGAVNTLSEWKKGKSRILAVQYASGSESIDLTRARYCIYYSLTQRLALYEQSRKRIHRPGQEKPVFYYHLIEVRSQGKTIDEKIYESLKLKKDVINYVIEKGVE